jgi:hypothetical protein
MNDFEYLSRWEYVRRNTKPIATMLFLALLLYCTINDCQNWMFFWAVLFIGECIPSDIYPLTTFFAIKGKIKEEKELNG